MQKFDHKNGFPRKIVENHIKCDHNIVPSLVFAEQNIGFKLKLHTSTKIVVAKTGFV
jgi:hypothetical protein